MPALRWLLRFTRPRSASEALTLILVLAGAGTVGALAIHGLIHSRRPGQEGIWAVGLFLAAGVARLLPGLRTEIQSMNAERAQDYLGSILIGSVALSFAWHLVSIEMNVGKSYLVLGPLGRATVPFLIGLGLLGFALLLHLPVHSWIASLFSVISSQIETARAPKTVRSTELLPTTWETYEDEAEASDEPLIETATVPTKLEQPPLLLEMVRGGPLLPPIDTFSAPSKAHTAPLDLDLKAQRIEETLGSFGVAARVVGHHSGPVVTQFDVQPERGVKVKSITTLQNDLALSLAAPTIRIQAPVPGKPYVGIEIPNSAAAMVSIRELFESEPYRASRSPLTVALGKDVAGAPVVIDLAKLPHLLIAGATGSGKSVCVNSLIGSLLFRNTPEDVRIMLVDPKIIELTVYDGIPHLLSPVITSMDRVVGVLQWMLREMERRYQLFADNTVRNIQRYNEKIVALGKPRLPYMVVVIDELADLMMVSPEEVEDAVCRLAQLARAAGIHLVIATQRPSVDVVTGLIKANFPARIAFAMTSQVDSRTILDMGGAEKLLGRGDMLYMPGDAPKPFRLQGAYLSDREIERLVEFWKQAPLRQAIQRISEEEFTAAEHAAAGTDDELLGEAMRVVREYQHASVSLLQRRLRIGYSRAARVMDQLEEHGVVGAADGSRQRAVMEAEEV